MTFTKEHFLDTINVLAREINYADSAFETFFLMKYGDKEWEEGFSIAPGFFSITRKAIFQESLLTISKLYKTGQSSERNLTKIIKLAEGNRKICKMEDQQTLLVIIEKCREELKLREHVIEKLSKWRDQVLAHYDNKYFLESSLIGEDAPLSAEEIRDLIENSRSMINDLSKAVLDEIPAGRYMNYTDVTKLMNLILTKKQ